MAIEAQILELKKKRAELWASQPRQEVRDYVFHRAGGGEAKLSELFGDREDLLLVHNMGRECPYCTLWADGFQSMMPHLESRTAFALVSNDDPETAEAFSKSRGWQFTVLSGSNNPFTQDMGFASEEWGSMPGVSAFHKERDGRIVRTAYTFFGPGDDFCPAWHFFDLLEGGAKGWEPQLKY